MRRLTRRRTSPGSGTRTSGSASKSSRYCRRRCAPVAGSDVDAFVESLKSGEGLRTSGHDPFEAGSRLVVARAPGRLDVMGGIADYSGSLVLQRPIAEATCVAVHRHERPVIEIASTGNRSIAVPVEALAPGGEPIAYDAAPDLFPSGSDRHWAAYCVGPLLVLMRDRNLSLRGGARIVIDSSVPEGKGVSSSAAIETASMAALAGAFDVTLSASDLALLCQKAEHLVAGAPCGVMDQMACVFGEPDALMALLCQPAQRLPPIPIPDDIAFWGLDSGARHFVGGSDYTAVRTAAFMGLQIISVLRGSGSAERAPHATDYLASITPREFEGEFVQHLPVEIAGADFLSRYGGTPDDATRVDPART